MKPQALPHLLAGLLLSSSLFLPSIISGQENNNSGFAFKIPVTDGAAPNGSVICVKDSLFSPCDLPYSPSMYGVIDDNPAGYFEAEDELAGRFVMSSGQVLVRASDTNGRILKGDFVTASSIPGVVQKATENGFVLGTALIDQADDAQVDSLILIIINIHPEASLSSSRSNLIQIIRQGTDAPLLEPLSSLRYILAALLILISFGLGFLYFGRVAAAGVEAIGRNPLARRMIQTSIFINIGVVVMIILSGLAAAYLVLIL